MVLQPEELFSSHYAEFIINEVKDVKLFQQVEMIDAAKLFDWNAKETQALLDALKLLLQQKGLMK
jgi:hypothetical protein